MLNLTLYVREMKNSIRMLIILAAVITMYVTIIIGLYNPNMMSIMDGIWEIMPELMASVGMNPGASSLLGFMVSYLYGFILLIFPVIFCILRGNGLIAKYADQGSMVSLMAAPVKRRTIAFTQMMVLVSGVLIIVIYSTILELLIAQISFPGELDVAGLLWLNTGLLCLHLFIGSICFLSSCVFSEIRYSIGFGAGIPIFMYVLQMLANVGGKAEKAKYFTFFTLFDTFGIIEKDSSAMIGIAVLFVGAIVLYFLGITIFCRKDLHI